MSEHYKHAASQNRYQCTTDISVPLKYDNTLSSISALPHIDQMYACAPSSGL